MGRLLVGGRWSVVRGGCVCGGIVVLELLVGGREHCEGVHDRRGFPGGAGARVPWIPRGWLLQAFYPVTGIITPGVFAVSLARSAVGVRGGSANNADA